MDFMGEVLRECHDAVYHTSVQAATEGVLLVLKKFKHLTDTARGSENAMESNQQPLAQLVNVESYEEKLNHALKELAYKWKDWLNKVLPSYMMKHSYSVIVMDNLYELEVRLEASCIVAPSMTS